MKRVKITEEHSDKIHSLISGHKIFTWQDIANVFDNTYTINQIKYHVNKHYPDLKSNVKKEYSKGGTKLEYLLKQIFPADKIVAEMHIGKRLRVDFIVKEPYNLAFEFDGSQHGKFTAHFHGDRAGFSASEARDLEKEQLLEKRGLNLIRISQLSIDECSLRKLIDQRGYGSGVVDKDVLTYKEKAKLKQQEQQRQAAKVRKQFQTERKNQQCSSDNSFAEKMKERQREYRKQQYQKAKEWKKKNKK